MGHAGKRLASLALVSFVTSTTAISSFPTLTAFADATAMPPSPPTALSAIPDNGKVTLSWSHPGTNGTSPLLRYDISVTASSTSRSTSPGPPAVVTVPANQTTTTISNLAEDCYSTYEFSVSAVSAVGSSRPSASKGPYLTSGWPPAKAPDVAVIMLDGAPSTEGGGSFYPLNVTSPASGIGTVFNYCPATTHNTKNSYPAGLQDSVWRWSEYPVNGATPGGVTSGRACLDTFVPTNCLTAALAATGAVLLPFSYTKASLSPSAAGDVFNMQSYGGCDSAGGFGCLFGGADPVAQRQALDDEITSIHHTWGSTRIALVGHSYGGMLAEQWWQNFRPTYKDHDGVFVVYSLDSPINGISHASLAITFTPDIQKMFANLWSDLVNGGNNDMQILTMDKDLAYRAIGTTDDATFGPPQNDQNPPISSQLDFTVDSSGNLFETPVDFESPCSTKATIADQVYGHDSPKVCPQVIQLIRKSLASVPQGSCAPSSSLIVMVNGSSVTSYIPKGNWAGQQFATGVSVVNIEGSSVTATRIPTPNAVNSCAPNPLTGVTVCTGNNTDVYVIKGTSLTNTLTSAGSGRISFSGGSCTNCGVAMDAVHNRAVIGMSINGTPGFQVLDLSSDTFGTPFAAASGQISEDPLVDPIRNLLLSPAENGTFEIVNISNPNTPVFYDNATGGGELDSSAEDCSTGIALAPAEFTFPSSVFIADLTQATFTGAGWTAPSQNQALSESNLSAGPTGIAIAQGTHIGIVAGEFGGNSLTAFSLPTTSGNGTPAIVDWVSCTIGNTPDGVIWLEGDDPHTLAAYQSPATKNAVGVLGNEGATWLAAVDLTKLLDPAIVARDAGGHACASGTVPSSVATFISVP